MADKMLRVAGRDYDGTAKAIKTDNDGNIKVKGGIRTTGSKGHFYDNGVEHNQLTPHSARAEGGITRAVKESDHLLLEVSGTQGNAHAVLATASKIDVTDIQKIFIEWEQIGPNASSNQSILALSNEPNAEHFDAVSDVRNTGSFNRTTSSLDVTDLTGEYYLRIMARDGSSTGTTPSELKVYSLYEDDGYLLKTHDDALVQKMKEPIPVHKREWNRQQQPILPGEEFVIVEDYEIPENISSWSLYAYELQRYASDLVDNLTIIVEYTDKAGEYYTENPSELASRGLVYRKKIGLSQEDEVGKGLITPADSEDTQGSNIVLSGEHFNQPMAKYMKITFRNDLPTSNIRLLNPTIVWEGNF